MKFGHELHISYGTSRGAETYGYGVVTLREDGKVISRAMGGGYDMRGTVFADWLEKTYQDRLRDIIRHKTHTIQSKKDGRKTSKSKGNFYGSSLNNDTGKITLDGGCGFESMQRIAEAIGLETNTISAGKTKDILIITDKASW